MQRGLALLASFSIALGATSSACVFEFEERQHRQHKSIGSEVYRVICMKLASQAVPNDLTGDQMSPRCDGLDDTSVVVPDGTHVDNDSLARLNALLSRRAPLVSALDSVFENEDYADDELKTFLNDMVPFYDPPSYLLPTVTRKAAALLESLTREDDATAQAALDALGRVGKREGYRPLSQVLGLAHLLAYPEIDDVIETFLAAVDEKDGFARAEWEELLTAMTLDLATAAEVERAPGEESTLTVARRLLFGSSAAFAGESSTPKWLTERDPRGIARVKLIDGAVPEPFIDTDGDGLVDVDGLGSMMVTSSVPPSFRTLPEVLMKKSRSGRDQFGRALSAAGIAAGCEKASDTNASSECAGEVLYSYVNTNETLLAGLTREMGSFLTREGGSGKTLTAPALYEMVRGVNTLLGPYGKRTWDFGDGTKMDFMGPDTSQSPLVDLVHALGAFLPHRETEQLLAVFEQLIDSHENDLAGLIEAVLYIDERSDLYPEAQLEKNHDFWDGMIQWGQEATLRPGLIEAILRTMTDDGFAQTGPLLASYWMFKDRVSYPGGLNDELAAKGLDPHTLYPKLAAGDAATAQAVQDDRVNLNYPCEHPPSALASGLAAIPLLNKGTQSVSDPECVPLVPFPAKNHKGIPPPRDNPDGLTHGCPEAKPVHGASCADVPGYGMCSWDEGSCFCDCAGGLCRGDLTPTWRCEDESGTAYPSQPGYEVHVDRSVPDARFGPDGLSNQSLFQRSAALVHDLHYPTKLCNKPDAGMVLYAPAGSTDAITDIPLVVSGGPTMGDALELVAPGLFGPYTECDALKTSEIVDFYSKVVIGRGKYPITAERLVALLDAIDSLNLGNLGLTGDSIMERQSQIRGLFMDAPQPGAFTRAVFGPMNPFTVGLLPLQLSRDGYPLVDLHSETMWAWELPDPVGGRSYLQVLTPLLTAIDEHELRDENGEVSKAHMFGEMITSIYMHWPSRRGSGYDFGSQRVCDDAVPPNCDTAAEFFNYQTNLVSYEALLADAVGNSKILERAQALAKALAAITVDGEDGLAIVARAVEKLLTPGAHCRAGDCENAPLTNRAGSALSTTGSGKPVEITPLHLLFDSLNAFDRVWDENPERHDVWLEARSELVDLLLEVDRVGPGEWKLRNARAKPILLTMLRFVRDQVQHYREEQEACTADGGTVTDCQQLRDWALGLAPRLERSLSQPVTAATLRLLERTWGREGDPTEKVLKLMNWVFDENPDLNQSEFDNALLSAHDLTQILDDDRNMVPIMRYLSQAVAPNALAVAAGKEDKLDISGGTLEHTLTLLRSLVDLNKAAGSSTITKISQRMVKASGDDGESPMDLVLDTVGEVNRVHPGADMGRPLNAADLRSALQATQEFLTDERHGIERLYKIVEARKLQ